MPDLVDDSLKVSEEFEVPEDAKPEKPISSNVQSETMREHSVLALTMQVPAEEYTKRLGDALKQLRKSAALPGFRKGKAPEALLRKRFGKQLEEDAVRDIAPGVFNQYAVEKKLRLASEATMEDFHFSEEEGLVIDYLAEIIPQVELKEYTGLKVEAPYKEPEEGEDPVEGELSRMREMFAERQVIEDGAIDDETGAGLVLAVRDERGKSVKGAPLGYRSISLVSRSLPKPVFEALKGKKAGEEITAVVENERKGAHGNVYSTKDTWEAKVEDVFRWNEPTIDDDWIKENLELPGGLEEFKKNVNERAEDERESAKRFAALHALYSKLAELNPIDPPRSFVERRYLALAESEMRRIMRMVGRPIPMSDRQREMIWTAADFDIKRAFIDQAVAEKEGLKASDEDVDAEIARLAEERGRKPLAVRAELERHKQLDELADSLKRKKVEEFLFANNEVAYVEPKDEEAEAEAGPSEDAAGDDS